jgi:SPP1 gp7 family putative phage head morphogenesis protein
VKLRVLNPIRDNPRHVTVLKDKLETLFLNKIYLPLLKSLGQRSVKNSIEDLLSQIQSGEVRYVDNGFIGVFTAEASVELKLWGAVWQPFAFKWLIRRDMLPLSINTAIGYAEEADNRIKTELSRTLESIKGEEVASQFNPTNLFRIVAEDMDRKFKASVKGIVVTPEFSKKAQSRIAKDYTRNLKLYIKNFTKKETLRLREQVRDHVFQGKRYEELAEIIKKSYDVSESKALFLARQETNLLTAKIKQVRYQDVGIDEYHWVAVTGTPAHPVRPLHQKLSDASKAGKTYSFSNPPVSGPKGEHQNPGEPYNCRCVARPIVRFK